MQIVSGVFNGRTTGMPITILIKNVDVDSTPYEEIKYKPRPGHADLPMIMKYGFDSWDYRGGGRLSGRETAARVAAGAIAKKLLCALDIFVISYIVKIGKIEVCKKPSFEEAICARKSPVKTFCKEFEQKIIEYLKEVIEEGDSIGGVVETMVINVPPGLGEPVFDKLKADLAKAIMSIPGTVGIEFGEGYKLSEMKGSEANDELIIKEFGKIGWKRNVQGGIVGGLSTGEPIIFRTYFKPTSSIKKPIKTIDLRTLKETELVVKGRHDPCIAIRAVPVVEAMTAIVILDHVLRAGYLDPIKLQPEQVRKIEENWKLYEELTKRCS